MGWIKNGIATIALLAGTTWAGYELFWNKDTANSPKQAQTEQSRPGKWTTNYDEAQFSLDIPAGTHQSVPAQYKWDSEAKYRTTKAYAQFASLARYLEKGSFAKELSDMGRQTFTETEIGQLLQIIDSDKDLNITVENLRRYDGKTQVQLREAFPIDMDETADPALYGGFDPRKKYADEKATADALWRMANNRFDSEINRSRLEDTVRKTAVENVWKIKEDSARAEHETYKVK